MFDREAIGILVSKVPDLGNAGKALLTALYFLSLALLCALFFFYVNRLGWYGPLLCQAIMAVVVAVISWVHFRKAGDYRAKYGALAYRHFFYHLMVPYLVTWYACFFHPLFVGGPPLMPGWLAIGIGVVFLVLFGLTSVHIERAGFHTPTHGLDVYTVFPEEATVVHGEIYSYIRHPLYFSLLCGSIGLAFMRNNAVALLVALLQLIPAGAAGWMEDRELVDRVGEAHEAYIRSTAALVPVRRLGGFLKLLFFVGD